MKKNILIITVSSILMLTVLSASAAIRTRLILSADISDIVDGKSISMEQETETYDDGLDNSYTAPRRSFLSSSADFVIPDILSAKSSPKRLLISAPAPAPNNVPTPGITEPITAPAPIKPLLVNPLARYLLLS